ncbi:type VII secretion protein EccE [Mycobacterium sp. ITM-2016-00317]|uniref:type VII secretion protein EccE n=1 Tax=Mycobacterium sp. ITM-2016-00317 TaxID=2099694 RepID=UPI00287F51F9|nr:type VII secretion protein EccE [Mycobacterium sp. ITM-2016-00317]WNG88118.1 type VII secretion protein EccE [Mycobacterium sp. ITM-2016-00317]
MTLRLTLAALLVVPAAMAYPWETVGRRWLLGVAIAAVVVLFARWRGHFVTTILGRQIGILLRRGRIRDTEASGEYTTVTLRLEPRESRELPPALIAGYLDRYGITFDKVRVTHRDVDGTRVTWVGLTLGAAANIAALSARSPRIPLRDTAEVAARRLADHLREAGWDVTVDDAPAAPLSGAATERYSGVDDGRGFLAAYRIAVDGSLDETFSAVRAHDSGEVWTVAESTGSRTRPELAAACVLRTADRPASRAPLPGLTPEHGRHARALAALAPGSDRRLLSRT